MINSYSPEKKSIFPSSTDIPLSLATFHFAWSYFPTLINGIKACWCVGKFVINFLSKLGNLINTHFNIAIHVSNEQVLVKRNLFSLIFNSPPKRGKDGKCFGVFFLWSIFWHLDVFPLWHLEEQFLFALKHLHCRVWHAFFATTKHDDIHVG